MLSHPAMDDLCRSLRACGYSLRKPYVRMRKALLILPRMCSPFARLGGLVPMGNRSTAIQLQGGDVWVLASTALDAPTRAKLSELGNVKCVLMTLCSTYVR
jgi:hypothetical protein